MDITRLIASKRDQAFLVGDYTTYRKKLSRRLLVVRRKLGYTSKGKKYTSRAPISAQNIGESYEYVVYLDRWTV